MIIKKTERKTIKIDKQGTVYDYPFPSEETGVSIQELNGRIPETGFYKNKICKEICYILSGSATVFINNKATEVSKEDIFVINPNEKHYILAKNLKIISFNSPNWDEKQCEHIQ